LAIVKAISTLAPEAGASPALYLTGGMAILAVPAAIAWDRGTLRVTGGEVIAPLAFHLSMYQSPLVKLAMGRGPLDSVEVTVLDMALYASLAVASLVSLRPGAFDQRYCARAPLDDLNPYHARYQAYAGVLVAGFGYTLFSVWVASVGLSRLATASVTDVYLYGANQATVSFQWPFIVIGILIMARAFARWPGDGPSIWLHAIYIAAIVVYVIVTIRLGARGPTIEILGAIYMVRSETKRPVPRRYVLIGAGILAFTFILGTAIRSKLYTGFEGASVSDAAEKTVSGEGPSEFDVIFENHVLIVRLAGTKIPYLEGDSWADLPMQLIPRQILGSKPKNLSTWWIRYVDAEAARRGAGRAFGSFAEGYLNYGVPGAVLQVSVVTIGLLALIPLIRSSTVGVAPAAASILALAYHCHRSEIVFFEFNARNAALIAMTAALSFWLIAALLKPVRVAA
jgi:hypothetical protein